MMISAPNFCACTKARPASAWPEMPVGNPQIVFDAGTGSGLAAIRSGIQDDHRQALGRRIDRGREPGRSAADDRDVIELCAVRLRDHAECARELGIFSGFAAPYHPD
jgi:hypothetical protein